MNKDNSICRTTDIDIKIQNAVVNTKDCQFLYHNGSLGEQKAIEG